VFGIGETELVIIVVFAFLLFGPDKLPGMGRTLGRVLRQFREASDGFTEVVQTNIMDPAADELKKSPKQRRREEEEAMSVNTMEGDAVEAAPEVAPRRETFAERKARLAAERAQREQAKAEDVAAPAEASSAQGESADAEATGQKDEAPARTTAADLYAMSGSRKSSRSRSDEQTPADAEADSSEAIEPAHDTDGEGDEASEA
jgi:TatA/E family protein of Tat protein translocase